jgi:adenylate cyclase
MSLGKIGAIDHYEYRPVGDIVNTASRLEGLNKYLGTKILVSQETHEQIDGILTRGLGKFLLSGKSKPLTVYELICREEESSEEKNRLCQIFAEALRAFWRQSWDAAIKMFHEAMEIDGEDGPSIFYLRLCENYKNNPPGEMWSGLVYFKTK